MSYYADYSDVVVDKHKVLGYRGIPPKNFGRFIPCRGGGTATTYYTDFHDVDEDKETICTYGGRWDGGAGITRRAITMRDISDLSSTSTFIDAVASRLIHLS